MVINAENDLLNDGTRVYATVTEKKTLFSSSDGDDYLVSYRFPSTDGKSVTSGHLISKPTFDKLNVGSRLEIAYNPNNPRNSIPTSGAQTMQAFVYVVAIILGVLSLLVFIQVLNSIIK